jgi:hypothetical protein
VSLVPNVRVDLVARPDSRLSFIANSKSSRLDRHVLSCGLRVCVVSSSLVLDSKDVERRGMEDVEWSRELKDEGSKDEDGRRLDMVSQFSLEL